MNLKIKQKIKLFTNRGGLRSEALGRVFQKFSRGSRGCKNPEYRPHASILGSFA